MDSNLDIYEPLELAGGNPEHPSRLENTQATSGENVRQRSRASKTYSAGEIDEQNVEQDTGEYALDDVSYTSDFFPDEDEEHPCTCSVESYGSRLSQRSYKGGWARYGLPPDPWDDEQQPTLQVLDYDDFELSDDELDGVLTDRIVYACSSYLDKNPESQKYTLAKFVCQEKNIRNIEILEVHRYLQYIDLSYNNLEDIWPLSSVPYLMFLNVSHNNLRDVLNFTAPWNLTYVDLSYNRVSAINDLSDFWSLVYLDLSNNRIKKIQGLSNLRYLAYLDLSMNAITCFENLSKLHIEELNISRNEIDTFEEGPDVGMATMTNLSVLDISCNRLSTLALFKGVYHMQLCNLEENQLADLFEIDHMRSMRKLTEVDFNGNGLTRWPKYRQMVINTLRSLDVLDRMPVGTEERIGSSVTFDPDLHIKTACKYTRMQLLEGGCPLPNIDLDIMPIDQGPFPLVVLVGPDGSCKKDLATWVAGRHPEKVHIGVYYTTRTKTLSEVEGENFYFVTQERFNQLANEGAFLYIDEFLGNSYGFGRHEIEKAVKMKKLCLAPMSILGALTLKAYGIEPTLVLVISESDDCHLERLQGKYRAALLQTTMKTSKMSICTMNSGAVSIGRRDPNECSIESEAEVPSVKSEAEVKTPVHSQENYTTNGDGERELSQSDVVETLSGGEAQARMLHGPQPSDEDSDAWFHLRTSQHAGIVSDSLRKINDRYPGNGTIRQSRDVFDGHLPSSYSNHRTRSDEDGRTKNSRPFVQFHDSIRGSNSPTVSATPQSTRESLIESAQYCLKSISEILEVVSNTNSPPTSDRSRSSLISAITMDTSGTISTISQLDHKFEQPTMPSDHGLVPSFTKIKESVTTTTSESRADTTLASLPMFAPLLSYAEDTYIRSIVKTRESYFETHRENPGLFAETIYTDDVALACRKFERFVRGVFRSRPQRYPLFDITGDKVYQEMMAQRLAEFRAEISAEQSAMGKQLEEMARYRPPRVPPQHTSSTIDNLMQEWRL